MSDDKGPLDRALELFVFAPVGLAASARELLPQLVARGRQQLDGQVSMARVIGQFAVQQGSVEAGKAIDRARASAQQALEDLGVVGSPSPSAPSDGDADLSADVDSVLEVEIEVAVEQALEPLIHPESLAPARATSRLSSNGMEAATLAIPDYDSLSASQVVPRLVGLTADELEAVRRYESAKRGRRTILNRVRQLRAP